MCQHSAIDRLADYNVTWTTPSDNAAGSMPLGNGNLALNAWVEPDGDLLLLLAKSDAWDENAINLKLGRLRVSLSPPLPSNIHFRQTLHLATGEILLQAGPVQMRLWVDAHRPLIHLTIESTPCCTAVVRVECWRTQPRTIRTQTSDMFKNLVGKNADPFPTVVGADHFFTDPRRYAIAWCHHNEHRSPDPFEVNLRLQGLAPAIDQMPHPLRGRTFGAAIEGAGFEITDDRTLRAAPAHSHHLRIHALTLHPASLADWFTGIVQQIDHAAAVDDADAWQKHVAWWHQFWSRSWIYITSADPAQAEATHRLTQCYILQRFMNAAAGRGPLPIKHNGSLFSVGTPEDPDYRRWGGPGFWFQNQRLIYWPMLASGDFDLLKVWLDMYGQMLPLQQLRTQTYFHHAGAHYPETVTFWGAEVSAHYGWTPFEKRNHPEAESPYLTYYWSGGIELLLLMCQYVHYTADYEFALSRLLPLAQNITQFYNLHYPRNGSGRLHFTPAQSLETWHRAENPLPEIAGLRYTLTSLLCLPGSLIPADLQSRCESILKDLPPLPIAQHEQPPRILPAEQFEQKKNCENPELYCVFPYRLFGVGRSDLQLARDTFAARLHVSHDCWSQDEIQMALLGLTEQARESLYARSSPAAHSDSRFPGFFNAFHDWIPDIDHAGVLQMALQLMLLQADHLQILLLPAWPRDWNADFRLHAADRRVIQGSVQNGQLVNLQMSNSAPQPAEQAPTPHPTEVLC